jgi:ABC-2 type transport system permease protein
VRYAPKNFIFMFAIGIPIILSLILSLAFGTLFAGKPKFGITDMGDSDFTQYALERESLIVRAYPSTEELRDATAQGAVDIGIVLPMGFDQLVRAGEIAEVEAFIWGESLLKERAILGATIAVLVREIAGQETPVEIISTIVGDERVISWEARLLPFVLLISILLAGTFVPATSIVEEKMKRTLGALVVSPSTLGEILTAKATLGVVVSVGMAVVVLFINRAFGASPVVLVGILVLGAIAAAVFGVFLGVLMKDINTLFATLKAIGLLLYAPAILYIFPGIPDWVSRLFPTHYIINPIIEVTQNGAGWGDVVLDLVVLSILIFAMVILSGVTSRRVRLSEA